MASTDRSEAYGTGRQTGPGRSGHWRLLGVAAVVVLTAAACGRTVGGATAAGDTATSPAAVQCEPGQTDGDLVLYNWSEYIDPELIAAFEDELGVSVTEDFYESNEALLAQIQAGASGYDVIVPSDYMVNIMRNEGLLLPLNKDALPNAANVAEAFADPPFDPGLGYSMPYQYGTTGIGVDLAVVGEDPPATWGLIFDPELSAEWAGAISLLDDPRETMAAALYYLGYSPNTTDETQLQEAADLIAETNDRIAVYNSDSYPELLVSGETAVTHGFSGNFLLTWSELDNADQYAYLIPEEGATRWVDTMAILADAPHPCTAHAFINFILDGENGAQLTNWNYYGSPNAAAEEFIDAELVDNPAVYPPAESEDILVFLEDTGDAEVLYTDLFTEAKS